MKFPKLPGLSKLLNFKKLLKKRSGDDDDSDEDSDDEIDDDFDGKKDEESSIAGDDDDSDADSDDDDDDDEDEEGTGSRKLLMIVAAGSFVLLAGIIGGAGWWYFSDTSDAPAKTAQKPDNAAKGPKVRMAMPAKPGSLNALLSPPPGGTMAKLGRPSGAAGKKPAMTPPALSPAKAAAVAADPMRGRRAGDIGGKFGGHANPLGGSLNAIGDAAQTGIGVVIPAVTSITTRNLPNHPGSKPLGPVPDVRLIEKKEGLPGVLPVVGQDGTMPWQFYARPFEAVDDRPKVAIAIIGLGLSRAATMAAIGKLPPEITLVLDPYAEGLGDWLVRARLVGHEVMVALPMESERFPLHDAGPLSMDTGLKVEDNLKRLELVLSKFTGYIGVATVMGSRFSTSESLLRPVLGALKERGLMLVTTGNLFLSAVPKVASEIGLPRVISDITLDDEPSRAAIGAKLERLEEIARERSVGVAIARPYPATIDRLIAWTRSLEGKKMVLVPISAVADTTQKKKKEE